MLPIFLSGVLKTVVISIAVDKIFK